MGERGGRREEGERGDGWERGEGGVEREGGVMGGREGRGRGEGGRVMGGRVGKGTLSPYTMKTGTFHGSINSSIVRVIAGPSLVGDRDPHNVHPIRQHLHIHSSTDRGVFCE